MGGYGRGGVWRGSGVVRGGGWCALLVYAGWMGCAVLGFFESERSNFLISYWTDGRQSFTYDHRTLKTRLPVRSALFKQRTGGLVVRWVTTSEYPLLYVFVFLSAPSVSYL